MKRISIFSLTVVAAIAITSLGQPVMANLQNLSNIIAQNTQKKSQIQLTLTAAKAIEKNQKTEWQTPGTQITATPGDKLRYTLKSENKGTNPVKNLVLTQPIPQGMTYILKSTTTPATYSIDNGKTYSPNPTIQIRLANGNLETQPAPANAYTHVRWELNEAIAPGQSTSVSYQVKVR
jgi:uncharacterized repeat protein (TIGR01451 family)